MLDLRQLSAPYNLQPSQLTIHYLNQIELGTSLATLWSLVLN